MREFFAKHTQSGATPSLKIVLYNTQNMKTNSLEVYKKLLAEIVKFKSISTDAKYIAEIERTVMWFKKFFTKNGFNVKIWRSKVANPVVFADFTVNKSLPTVLIYGHYDVQPANKSDGWKSEPFSLAEGKSKIYARGVVDNKGQVLIHIVNAIDLAKSGNLKYNVKFLIEGNEETGSTPWQEILSNNRKLLACDFVVVSDGELTNNMPTIEVSLRGGFNCKLKFTTGKNNLHSGLVGGAVANSAEELSRFMSILFDLGKVGYKEFYANVDKPTKNQLANNAYLSRTGKNLAELFGVKKLLLPKNVDFFTQTGLVPTIQITGFKSGYIETGYSNIVPATAEVRLNFRLVASQKADKVAKSFKKFVAQNVPSYVDYELSFSGLHEPVKIDTNNKYVEVAENILKKVYKTRVNRRNVGGAIPFVGDVKDILKVDTLLIPLVNEDCNMHGVDENFDVTLVRKALEFSRKFLGKD